MSRYAIGLGSNLGDRLDHLSSAVADIAGFVENWSISSLYETEPVGGPEQDPYLNAVMTVESSITPFELLDRLQAIEASHGRERDVRWGPRTLDLDVVAMNRSPLDDERLTVPHPRARERAFVLVPLIEVWPDASLGDGWTAEDAMLVVDRHGVDRLSRDWIPPVSPMLPRLMLGGQFVVLLTAGVALVGDGRLPEGGLTALGIVGAMLAISGLILVLMSSRRLGPSLTASPVPRKGGRLVADGPYCYARHPIYGGISLFLLGTALFLDSVYGILASVLAFVFLWAKSTYEERLLRMRFAGYRRYRQAVRRRLIPFVI